MSKCIGKILIVASLLFQAYVLFENENVAKQFDNNLSKAMAVCDCIPDNIVSYILLYGRFLVVGLLGLSVSMLVCSFWGVKLLVIMGLLVNLYIEHQPFNKLPCIGCANFWTKVSTIGALIYLMGADCNKQSCTKLNNGERTSQPSIVQKVQENKKTTVQKPKDSKKNQKPKTA